VIKGERMWGDVLLLVNSAWARGGGGGGGEGFLITVCQEAWQHVIGELHTSYNSHV